MRLRPVLIALLGLLLAAASAAAQPRARGLSGSAELVYGEFKAREDGRTVSEVSEFGQQYSLLWNGSGRLFGGRAGAYDVALGYMWTSLDAEVDGTEVDLPSAGKVLYRGDLLVAPGGLPFRLHLYSHDLQATSLIRESTFSEILADQDGPFGSDFGMFTNYYDGQHITTGATFLAGIRNGSYLGAYRDILSQLPRLMIDYQEERVRDLKSATPEHYRTRDLAFISLNKKDNWFHYRHHDHKDYLDPENDYREKSYTLGTIDHNLQRQWVNLTNWIQVSADGTLTKGRYRIPQTDRQEEERYNLNLFTLARRSRWTLSNFTTFERLREGTERLEKQIEIPFFLSGEPDRNTSWRARLIGYRDHDALSVGLITTDNLFASGRVEVLRTRPFILAPLVEVEFKRGERGEGNNQRAGLEIYSNRTFNPRVDLFGSYTVSHFAGTGQTGLDVDFWEQSVTGRVEASLSPAIRTGITQRLLYGTGTFDWTAASYIQAESQHGLTFDEMNEQRDGTVLRSTTTWFGEHRRGRLSNRLELEYDYLSEPEKSDDVIRLTHDVQYTTRNLSAKNRSQFNIGTVDAPTDAGFGSAARNSFTTHGVVHYSPGRTWEASGDVDYEWLDFSDGSSNRWDIEQDFRYNVYKVNGVIRKLLELEEGLDYERFYNSRGDGHEELRLHFTTNYFPTRYLLLGGTVAYEFNSVPDTDSFIYALTAGLNFTKLQINFDYAYGTRTESDSAFLPERDEQRWELRVKKVF